MRSVPLVLILVGCVVACGTGVRSLTGSSDFTSESSVVSGRDGAPVSGLVVTPTAHGVQYSAPGFVSLVTSKRGQIILRPQDRDLSLEYTRALAFPNGRVIRWGAYVHRIGILTTPAMRRPDVRERLTGMIQVMNATQSAVTFSLDAYDTDAQISVRFDSRDPSFIENQLVAAVAHVRFSASGVIQEATIVFPAESYVQFAGWFETVLTHEVGHALGLGHTPAGIPGMMSAGIVGARAGFGESESVTLGVQYSRGAGTQLREATEYEDAFASLSGESHEMTIVCQFLVH